MRNIIHKLSPRHKYLTENNFEKAKELAAWKKTMREEWDNIEVLNYSFEKSKDNVYRSGQDYIAEIALNVNKIPRENVGVEFIITQMNKQGDHRFVASEELKTSQLQKREMPLQGTSGSGKSRLFLLWDSHLSET